MAFLVQESLFKDAVSSPKFVKDVNKKFQERYEY